MKRKNQKKKNKKLNNKHLYIVIIDIKGNLPGFGGSGGKLGTKGSLAPLG